MEMRLKAKEVTHCTSVKNNEFEIRTVPIWVTKADGTFGSLTGIYNWSKGNEERSGMEHMVCGPCI